MINFFLANVMLPIFEKCSKTNFWSLYKEMHSATINDQGGGFPRTEKVVKVLENAANNTVYWQNLIEINHDAPIRQLLSAIPVSQKVTYSQRFPDQVTAQNLDSSDWQYLSSAGTTGRMTVVVDFLKRDYLRAAEHLNLKLATGSALGLKSVDIPPSACNVVCGFADQGPESIGPFIWWAIKNKRLFLPETISDLRGRVERQIMLKREVLLPVDSAPWHQMCEQLDKYLDHILQEKIRVIRALPHFLLWLSKRAEQRNLAFPHLTTILPYGGLAGEALVNTICRVFQANYVNVYGTGEVGSIGCATSKPHIVDIYQDMVCLEVLSDDNSQVPLNTPGRVVITDLNNFAMPIIRYEIGDIAEVIEFSSEDGLPRKIRVLGRQQECLELLSGKCVTPIELQDTFFQYTEIINYKVEQLSPALFKINIVTIGEFNIETLKQDLMLLFEMSKAPIIKQSEFILPEQSGKFLAAKILKRNT